MPFNVSDPTAAGSVDDDERTVILGVDVTPVLSVARRKLGIERAGCGLALPALVLVFEADPFTLGVEPSLEDDELKAVEPAVLGLCVLADDTAPEEAVALSDVRVDVDSCVPLVPADATESAGLDRPLDSDARLLVDGVGRKIGVPAMRGESLDDDVAEAGRPLDPMRGVIWPGVALVSLVSAERKLVRWVDDDADELDRLVLLVELPEADD